MLADWVDSIEYYGNLVEMIFWIAIGAGFFLSMIWPPRRTLKALAGAFLIFFGLSDFVEAHTGAWWKPWWLLVWKVSCVLAFIVLLALYYRSRRARAAAARTAAGRGADPGGGAAKVDS